MGNTLSGIPHVGMTEIIKPVVKEFFEQNFNLEGETNEALAGVTTTFIVHLLEGVIEGVCSKKEVTKETVVDALTDTAVHETSELILSQILPTTDLETKSKIKNFFINLSNHDVIEFYNHILTEPLLEHIKTTIENQLEASDYLGSYNDKYRGNNEAPTIDDIQPLPAPPAGTASPITSVKVSNLDTNKKRGQATFLTY